MNHLSNVIESILFLSGKPVEESFIREKLEVSNKEFKAAVAELLETFSGESGIHLLHFNGKLQFSTNPSYVHEVETVLNPIKEKELTNAMLETLAIIAYKQPVTRLDIEDVRGVDCSYAVQNLTNLGLVECVGRKEAIGKPLLFATTDNFLKRFSIDNVTELPDYESLLEKLKEISYGPEEVEAKPMFSAISESATAVAESVRNETDVSGKGYADNVGAEVQTAQTEGGTDASVSEAANDAATDNIGAPQATQASKSRQKRSKKDKPDSDSLGEEIPDFLKGESVEVVE